MGLLVGARKDSEVEYSSDSSVVEHFRPNTLLRSVTGPARRQRPRSKTLDGTRPSTHVNASVESSVVADRGATRATVIEFSRRGLGRRARRATGRNKMVVGKDLFSPETSLHPGRTGTVLYVGSERVRRTTSGPGGTVCRTGANDCPTYCPKVKLEEN